MKAQTRLNIIALIVPAGLMLGALVSQYLGHLSPCEMCWWQRYPHIAAIIIAAIAFFIPDRHARALIIAAAAGAILTSGLLGVYHAGVEWKWWEGPTACTAQPGIGADYFRQNLMASPVRCDEAQWRLFGISLAGFNAVISIAAALFIYAGLFRASER